MLIELIKNKEREGLKIGCLYKVKPNSLILSANDTIRIIDIIGTDARYEYTGDTLSNLLRNEILKRDRAQIEKEVFLEPM